MKLDEKQCGDRVKKWQEHAMEWKGQVDALKTELQKYKDQVDVQATAEEAGEPSGKKAML